MLPPLEETMRLYFARHGESEANLLRVVSNRPGVHPLTDAGRAQAEALAEAVRGRVSRVYASPLLRAVETAGIVCGRLDLPCEVADALREYDCGELEGRSDADAWAEHARWFADWAQGRGRDRSPEGGESFEQIRARFVPFVRSLGSGPSRPAGAPLLIGHGGIYRLMLPEVLTNVDYGFVRDHGIANGGVVVAEDAGGRLVCLDWCGVRPPD
jgi:broad specificity phosphatase PhoE